MKEEELRRLVEKYYNGESTEEEENTLKEFFRMNSVPEGYEAEKEIFSYYNGPEDIPEPSIDFEARIMAGIDASVRVTGTQKARRNFISVMSVAAGLILLAGSYFLFVKRSETADTFSDPKIAYAETIKILRDVSFQLNHGARSLEPVSKINKVKTRSIETINKSTRVVERNLDYLQKTIEISHNPADNSINK
jgi:hypothetical protein